MAKSGVVLTKTLIDRAEPRAAGHDLWDDSLSSFGVRVEVSGSKTFIVRYKTDGGGRHFGGSWPSAGTAS
jgi:hypothetical protein